MFQREYLLMICKVVELATTKFFSRSDSILLQDFNIEIKRKINKKLKLNVNYFNFVFNDDAVKVANYYKMIYVT